MKINKDSIYYLELFMVNRAGNPATGLSITYTITKSSDDSVVDSGSLIEIGSGNYKSSYIFTVEGQYRINYQTPSGYSNEVEYIIVETERAKESTLQSVKQIVELIEQAEFGRWKIDVANKKLLFYKEDNTTLIAEFDLYNQNGIKAVSNVTERKRVL